MQTQPSPVVVLALACATATSLAFAQSPQAPATQGALFAKPVQLSAGDKLLGKGRLYPSPALHDLNGDGRLDVFIGDLFGKITYALRQQDGSFGSEHKLKDANGKILDFGNW